MKTNAIIIFVRNPELGKVKTRLAQTIGNEKALEVYRDLLFHTMSVTQIGDYDKFVFYDCSIELNIDLLEREDNAGITRIEISIEHLRCREQVRLERRLILRNQSETRR